MWDFLQWVAVIGLSVVVVAIVLALCVAIFFGMLASVMSSFRGKSEEAYSEDHFYVRLDGKWLKVVSPEPSSFTTEDPSGDVRNVRKEGSSFRNSRPLSQSVFVRTPPKGTSGASDAFKGKDKPHFEIG